MFENIKKVLVFGAHGDDEIKGCGGTIAYLAEKGTQVTVITFTNRETSYAALKDKNQAAQIAKKEMANADNILGISREILELPTHGIENNRDNFQLCTKLIRKYRPDIIFTHIPNDHHRDHRAVSILISEARGKASSNISPDWGEPWHTQWVLQFEIYNLIEKPHLIHALNKRHIAKKIEAMRSQISQMNVSPFIIQHMEGLSKTRGASIGAKWGEAFRIDDFHPAKF